MLGEDAYVKFVHWPRVHMPEKNCLIIIILQRNTEHKNVFLHIPGLKITQIKIPRNVFDVVKRQNFSHSWNKSQIFNRDSCKNLLVSPSNEGRHCFSLIFSSASSQKCYGPDKKILFKKQLFKPWGQRSRSHKGHYGTWHTALCSCKNLLVSPSNEGRHCFSLIFSSASSQRSLSGP
jgi:hypothetical protein